LLDERGAVEAKAVGGGVLGIILSLAGEGTVMAVAQGAIQKKIPVSSS
jgi:hypothetical protein